MSWETVDLYDICRPKQWKTVSSVDLLEDGFPIYGANGRIGYYSEYTHEFPTLMITCRGATCGNVHISVPKSYINGNAMALDDLDSDRVFIKYLYFYFKTRGFNDVISGSAQPQITRQGLSKIKIPLPPLPVQKQIAAVLEKADTLRQQCQQMEQELSALAQSVFLDMFGDPVANPKGWKKQTLKSISVKFNDGPFGSNLKTSHYTKCGVQVIRLTNIGVGEFKNKDKMFVSEEHAETLAKFKCSSGDIVIATLGEPNLRACIIPNNVPVAINKADCIHCVPNSSIVDTEYLMEFLNLPFTLQSIQNLLHGQTRTRISSGQLAKVEILIPPLEKQNEFTYFVRKVNAELSAVKLLVKEKERLFNSLMQRAFKGELELKDVA